MSWALLGLALIAGFIDNHAAEACDPSLKFWLTGATITDSSSSRIDVTASDPSVQCGQAVAGRSNVCTINSGPTNSYIQLNTSQMLSTLPFGSEPRTACVWGLAEPSHSGAYLISYGASWTNFGVNDLYGRAWGGEARSELSSSTVVFEVGTWTHTCVTFNGTWAELFVDGVLISNGSVSWNTSTVAATGFIGCAASGWQNLNWVGSLYDVRIYDRALAEAEVADIYNTPANNRSLICDASGRLVYVSYWNHTELDAVDLARSDEVEFLRKLYSHPTPVWPQSSATNGRDVFFYTFLTDDNTTGFTEVVNITSKKPLFYWNTDYFWSLAYDPNDPEHLYGLSITADNIVLAKIDVSTGKNQTVGQLPAGVTEPRSSAIYDPTAHVYYAYVQGSENVSATVYGIDVTTGDIVSKASVNESLFVCGAVLDQVSGVFYGLAHDDYGSAWLAALNPLNGTVAPLGADTLTIMECLAGTVSSIQGIYYVNVKDLSGASLITAWSLSSGALLDQFAVTETLFGMQYYEA